MDSHTASRGRRLQLLWRIPWSFLNAFHAALLVGVLVWGPLNGALPVVLVAGTLAGLAALVLWGVQTRTALAGDRRRARRLGTWLLGVPLSVVAIAAAVALAQLYTMGAPAPRGDRLAEFERLWRTVDRHYVYFEQKGVDWDAVYATYRPRVAAAEDDGAYFRAIYEMLAELHDGHTGLQEPAVLYDGLRMFGYTRDMAGETVVTTTGQAAAEVGLEEGAVLLAVNGEPVAARLAHWMDRIAPGSSPWHHRRIAHYYLLATYEDELEVTFEDLDGQERTEVLLIDHHTLSSGEAFAVALADSDRAYVIGRRTAGATGNPVPFRLQGGRARYSTGDFRRNDGSRLEEAGVAPDLTVTWTREDFVAGIDPDIDAAEAYLLSQ